MRKHEQEIKQLINGELETPNKFIEYLVDTYKVARAEFDLTLQSISKLQSELAQLRERSLVLEGGINKTVEDIHHWYAKALEKNDDREDKSNDGDNQASNVEVVRLPVHGTKNNSGRKDNAGVEPDKGSDARDVC